MHDSAAYGKLFMVYCSAVDQLGFTGEFEILLRAAELRDVEPLCRAKITKAKNLGELLFPSGTLITIEDCVEIAGIPAGGLLLNVRPCVEHDGPQPNDRLPAPCRGVTHYAFGADGEVDQPTIMI